MNRSSHHGSARVSSADWIGAFSTSEGNWRPEKTLAAQARCSSSPSGTIRATTTGLRHHRGHRLRGGLEGKRQRQPHEREQAGTHGKAYSEQKRSLVDSNAKVKFSISFPVSCEYLIECLEGVVDDCHFVDTFSGSSGVELELHPAQRGQMPLGLLPARQWPSFVIELPSSLPLGNHVSASTVSPQPVLR